MISQLISSFEIVSAEDGEVIFNEGDAPDFFYVVLKGHCDLFVRHQQDIDSSLVATYGPGNEMGDGSFIHNLRRRKATAQARGNVVLARLSGQKFASFISRHKMDVHPGGSSKALLRRVLMGHPLFKQLSDDQIEEAVSACYKVSFNKDEEVISHGEYGDAFYIIENGLVDIMVQGPDQHNMYLKERRSRGECFGEASLICNSPRGATAKVSSDHLSAWELDRTTFSVLTKGGSNMLMNYFRRNSSVATIDYAYMTTSDMLKLIGCVDGKPHSAEDYLMLELLRSDNNGY